MLESGNEELFDKMAPLDVELALDELVTADEATFEEDPAFVELRDTDRATRRVDVEPGPEAPNGCVEEKVLTTREPLELVPIMVDPRYVLEGTGEEGRIAFDLELLDG